MAKELDRVFDPIAAAAQANHEIANFTSLVSSARDSAVTLTRKNYQIQRHAWKVATGFAIAFAITTAICAVGWVRADRGYKSYALDEAHDRLELSENGKTVYKGGRKHIIGFDVIDGRWVEVGYCDLKNGDMECRRTQ